LVVNTQSGPVAGLCFDLTKMNTDNPQHMPEDAAADAREKSDAETALENRLAEMSDAYLRAKAESENARRRADEDISKARKFAVEGFAEAMLPVLDSLEAAIGLPNATVETLLEGVHATRRQLMQALERNKVIEINPAQASKFDPHHHQAISVVPLPPDAQQEAGTVVAVLQKGYLIADRVLRPALVTVSAPK
jgi:molecular chaperone GrpE